MSWLHVERKRRREWRANDFGYFNVIIAQATAAVLGNSKYLSTHSARSPSPKLTASSDGDKIEPIVPVNNATNAALAARVARLMALGEAKRAAWARRKMARSLNQRKSATWPEVWSIIVMRYFVLWNGNKSSISSSISGEKCLLK